MRRSRRKRRSSGVPDDLERHALLELTVVALGEVHHARVEDG